MSKDREFSYTLEPISKGVSRLTIKLLEEDEEKEVEIPLTLKERMALARFLLIDM